MSKLAKIFVAGALLTGCGSDAVGEGDAETGDTGSSGADPTSESDPATTSASAEGSEASTDPGEGTGESSSTGEPGGEYEAEIVWEPCPLYTDGPGLDAQCATVEVPADWDDIQGAKLEIFVKRIGAMQGDKQLWMLMGGPGGAARSYEGSAETYTGVDPELTVYLLDHRGTGRSTFLACPTQEAAGSDEGRLITLAEVPACVEHLENTYGGLLDQYNTTNASFDLGWLIDQVRSDEAVHVFGSSYGTYWAQRYLQIYGEQADSMTLLGITDPAFSFTVYDPSYNDVGESFMAACGDDPFCSARLGPDPVATMRNVYDMLDAGHCPAAQAAGIDRAALRVYFGSLLSWGGDERARIPATLYRLERCNAQDVTALTNAAPQMQDPLGGLINDPFFSVVINRHISFSEMWEAPFPTQAEIDSWEDALLFSLSSTTSRFEIYPLWPTYPEPELDDMFAATDIPILMLNGEYDPNSPAAQAMPVGEHYSGPNQNFFVIPDGNHGWFSPTTEGYGCAENMFFSFFQDPTGPLLDCIGDVVPIDWEGSPADAQAYFGTNDLYD